ncbi:MAG TPA: hypothetical protein VFM41_05880 [Gaiella sp.]|nr:hypothetical protein [Gaiella sp.]
MPPRKRNSPEGHGNEWVGEPRAERVRPWAYESLLLGSEPDRELDDALDELRRAHDELTVLYRALDQQIARIEVLERRARELSPTTEPEPVLPVAPPRTFPYTGLAPDGAVAAFRSPGRRIESLARCEGFEVDSPVGPVGVVEGLRFVSRIDRPDFLEVRGGRFGRQLLVIPVDQVEEVRASDQLVVLRSVPAANEDLIAELVERVRVALHLDAAS